MLNTIILDKNKETSLILNEAFIKTDYINYFGIFDSFDCFIQSNEKINLEMAFINLDTVNIAEINNLKEKFESIIIVLFSKICDNVKLSVDYDADYFLPIPFTNKNILNVLEKMRLIYVRLNKKVYIRTFGYFDVFVDGKPIYFKNSKSKELLAYLTDRNGGVVTTREGYSVLWEEKPYDHNYAGAYRRAIKDLKETLEKNGAVGLLFKLKNGYAMNKNAVFCDYFEFLDGNSSVINNWNGEYLTNYSWGEYTLSALLEINS